MTDLKGAGRRMHERYELKESVFITFRPDFDQIAWLMDIGKGGVSFKYSTINGYPKLNEDIYVDIFSSPKKFNLNNLPCKLVYETTIDNEKGFIENGETRRCGLIFGQMSQHQAAQLDVALNLYSC